MKKYFTILALFIATVCFLGSCDSDTKSDAFSSESDILETLTKYKWTTKLMDYDVSEDYIYFEDGYVNLYFMQGGYGRELLSLYQIDSDGLNDSRKQISYLRYYINNGKIRTEIESPSGHIINGVFKLENKRLIPVSGDLFRGYVLEAKEITSSDYNYIPSSGSCGSNLQYTYDPKTHSLNISGTGDMYDYSLSNQPWHNKYVEKVYIEREVTSIGKNAFRNMQHLTFAELPYSLKTIGDYAFSGSLLTSIEIPSTVREIGVEAFSGCSYLKSVDITYDNEIERIGKFAFAGCDKLSFDRLMFTECLRTIEDNAFADITIENLSFEEGVESIGHNAFGDITDTGLELPNSLKKIGTCAFVGSFRTIEIGENIEEISSSAFYSYASSGKLYINIATPLSVDGTLIGGSVSGAEYKWTLYVPEGCKTAYSKKSPWNKFKSIIEDTSLSNGNSNNNGGNDIINGYEYVDLGLSVKWASCNVGASSPEEYGDYFAWGETQRKVTYSKENCKTYNKYISDISGNPEYDAATANWGGTWRLPTLVECKELVNDCTWNWVTQNGVKGYRVTGPNDNSIFLPAAGYRSERSLIDANHYGNYQSSTPDEDYTGLSFAFSFDISYHNANGLGLRYSGKSVRPVTE